MTITSRQRGRRASVGRLLSLCLLIAAFTIDAATAERTTVRHAGQTITLDQTLDDPKDLWVLPADLTRINGFVLKPEGACLEDVCIPIRQDRDSDLLVTRAGHQWVNLSALARKINQKFTVDYDRRVWSFGPLPFKSSASPKKGAQ